MSVDMTRWRVEPPEELTPEPVAVSCQPHVVETARGLVVRRFACIVEATCLCPCLLDAIEFSRHFTGSTGRVVVVLREADRLVLARTGPSRLAGSRDPFQPSDQKKEE